MCLPVLVWGHGHEKNITKEAVTYRENFYICIYIYWWGFFPFWACSPLWSYFLCCWLIFLLLPGNKREWEKKMPKWLAVWNTSFFLHVSGLQLLISWAPLDTHQCLLIFCLTHVPANQPVMLGYYANSHPLAGVGYCLTFTWLAVQHPGNLQNWN